MQRSQRHHWNWNFLLTLLIGLSGMNIWAASDAVAAVSQVRELSFQLRSGHLIVIKGSIGDLQDLNCVIDTGASRTLVTRRIARKLKLKSTSERLTPIGKNLSLKGVMIPELRLGGVPFTTVPAFVVPGDLLPGRVDVLVGIDLLRQTNLGVDFVTRTLTFGLKEHYESKVRFYPKGSMVRLRILVDSQALALMLDSGRGEFILFRDAVKAYLRGIPNSPAFRFGGGGGSRTAHDIGGRLTLREIQLQNVRMGPTQWTEISAFLSDPRTYPEGLDGILGVRSLGLERFQLDFEKGVFSWEH